MNPFQRIILCSFIALHSLSSFAADPPTSSFQWPAWEIPAVTPDGKSGLEIVKDEDAESTRTVKGEDGKETKEPAALVRRVSRRAIAKSALSVVQTKTIEWAKMVPGVYRLSARVKYSGDENIIGTPIQLSVSPDQRHVGDYQHVGRQDFYSFDLGASDEWTEISLVYEVDPKLEKRMKARQVRHSWRYGGYLHEIYPDYERKVKKLRQPPAGLVISVTLPRTKYSSTSGMPPNSVRHVSVDWVKFERIQPSEGLTVRHVRPQKRWLRPGEGQAFDVLLENFGDAAASNDVVLTLVRGIDERKEIHRESVTLEPGAQKAIRVEWPTTKDTPNWGYEIVAEALSGNTVQSSANDYFSLRRFVYEVHIMGGNERVFDPYRNRGNRANLMEVFAATPGDCALVMPKADQWMSGMSVIPQSFDIVRRTTDFNREMGVATHMYLFAGGTAAPLMDLYIKRPQWFASRLVATDEVYYKTSATDKMVREHDFSKGGVKMPKTPHIEQHMNWWYPEMMEKVTKESIEFIKRAGYEGVRFDVGLFGPKSDHTVFGEKLPFSMDDAMKKGAENYSGYVEALRKEFPDIEFGANMDTWAYLETVGRRNEEAPPPEEYPEFIAFANSGGMFMDEGTMNASFFNHYMNRFEDAIWSMSEKRAMARRFGGTYQLFSPHRDGKGYFAHDDIYYTIMIIASGSYYVGNFTAAPYCEESPADFITRFSEYFRGMNLKPLEEAEELVYMDAPELLWYADASVYEDIGNTRRYVIPIVNPPVNDRMRRNKSNELPPPIDDPFAIEVKVPDGYQSAKAWMLTWEPRVEAVALDVTLNDGTAAVEFPGIKLFRTLVMEFDK